jgi:hypothetical protein
MLKRKITKEMYLKMGVPDLGSKLFFTKKGKRIYGKCCLLSFSGFKGAKNGLVLIGIIPY